jgi:hypothetical protein
MPWYLVKRYKSNAEDPDVLQWFLNPHVTIINFTAEVTSGIASSYPLKSNKLKRKRALQTKDIPILHYIR